MKLSWSHTVINVRDLDQMLAFYTNVLGFEISDRGPLGPGAPPLSHTCAENSERLLSNSMKTPNGP